jgi:hypothetical protein
MAGFAGGFLMYVPPFSSLHSDAKNYLDRDGTDTLRDFLSDLKRAVKDLHLGQPVLCRIDALTGGAMCI